MGVGGDGLSQPAYGHAGSARARELRLVGRGRAQVDGHRGTVVAHTGTPHVVDGHHLVLDDHRGAHPRMTGSVHRHSGVVAHRRRGREAAVGQVRVQRQARGGLVEPQVGRNRVRTSGEMPARRSIYRSGATVGSTAVGTARTVRTTVIARVATLVTAGVAAVAAVIGIFIIAPIRNSVTR